MLSYCFIEKTAKMRNLCALFVLLIIWTREGVSLPHIYKEFKCAGDSGNVCETGLCYDALGFYENGQNVGCAQEQMCTKAGCLMYKGVFTCCCANRFCNGKTEMLMKSKFEMFKQNRGRWPTNLPPRIFARNITAVPPTESPDVRKAPTRKITTTTEAGQQKVVDEKLLSPPLESSSSISTTTQIANLPPSKPQPKPLIIEQEVKLSSFPPKQLQEEAKVDGDSIEKDNERTTRSYLAQKDGTTARPPTHREEHYPSNFPWYAVTIVGFITASIIGTLGYFAYQRFRKWQATKGRRTPSDSMRHPSSSVDSSLLAEEARR
ncbi:hypothetical protein M3Y97_00942400 [Aphelenchoides bicaudatus]|nr:hypothetical protein M3Y97_00942400 [Aphelenchoides bicaudatus]